jgi:hypothetical protein
MIPTGIVSASAPRESWLLVSAAWILLVAASCSSADIASPPGSTATSPSPPIAVDVAPRELQGVWVTILNDGTRQQVTLTLSENAYQIRRGGDRAVGAIAVHGDQIEFSQSSLCVGAGTYRWSLKGNSLLFTPVNSDPCPGRSEVLEGQAYSKGDGAS